MKSILTILLFLFAAVVPSAAQTFRGLDKSPLDIAYFPDHFAHDRKEGQKALVKVVYSRPFQNNRELFGSDLAPFGKVWRTGANEATEIRFYQDAIVGGKKITKGTYSLFTIPGKESWTIIFNSDLDYWGAYTYKEKNDVLRVTVQPETLDTGVENFSIQFREAEKNKAEMMMAWGNTVVKVPMEF
jgi:hypothetical protein